MQILRNLKTLSPRQDDLFIWRLVILMGFIRVIRNNKRSSCCGQER